MFVVALIPNPVLHIPAFPDFQVYSEFLFRSVGKSTFDELYCAGDPNVDRRYEQMNVIRHDHELVQQVSPFGTIVQKHVNQESCHPLGLKE
jgi:hypothetical protein